jgi:hypothetical protein
MRKIERGYTPEESHEIFLNAYKYAKRMKTNENVKLIEQPKGAKSACEGCCFNVNHSCLDKDKSFDCIALNAKGKGFIYVKQ